MAKIKDEYNVKFEPVDESQISDFINLLSESNNLLVYAASEHRYNNFKDLNADVIEEINQISETINNLSKNVKNGLIKLYSPVYVPCKNKYYELHYFRGRKNCGSIYVGTELKLSDEEDIFLQKLINIGLITKEAYSICSIDEISSGEYKKVPLEHKR